MGSLDWNHQCAKDILKAGIASLAKKEHQDQRRCPRFKLDTELTVHIQGGTLSGRTVDISETGIAAILPIEVRLGDAVELAFNLPLGPVRVPAVARQRLAFRWGFEFVKPEWMFLVRTVARCFPRAARSRPWR